MRLEAGDLVLLPFPFSDLSGKKTRPALVVSSGLYNEEGADVIVCGITSNLTNASHSVLIDSSDLTHGTLPARSRVKADKLATLEKSIVRRVIGRLDRASLDRVFREIEAILKP